MGLGENWSKLSLLVFWGYVVGVLMAVPLEVEGMVANGQVLTSPDPLSFEKAA